MTLPDSNAVDSSLEKLELKTIVENALMKLAALNREILIFKEFENNSYKEIAEFLNILIGIVMSKLFYARKKLAVLLDGVEL